MKEIFPERGVPAPPAAAGAPGLAGPGTCSTPTIHPLWGIEHGCRTVVDLLARGPLVLLEPDGAQPGQPGGRSTAMKIGQNVVDYATGREMPADKLVVREVRDFKAETPKRGRPADRQAQARRRLEHRPAGHPQPDGRPPQAPFSFDVVLDAEGPLPARPEPGLLPADLHPRPRRAVRSPRRTSTPCAATSSPAAARSSPTPPAAAPPSTPPSAGSSPSCSPTTRSSRSPATTSSTPRRSASTSPTASTPRPPAAARTSPSSRASRSTATGRSSTRSSTSAAPSSGTRGSTARDTPTRAPCRIAGNIVIYSTFP